MEFSPAKLAVACAALFGGVVAIAFLSQYRSQEEFKQSFSKIDFTAFRRKLEVEEGLDLPDEPQPQQQEATTED